MVKKLLKYEMQYYKRILLPIFAGFTGFAVIIRLLLLFEHFLTEETEDIIFVVSYYVVLLFFYAFVALTVVTTILTIIRFFKNMFGGEGYLTLTLPVSLTSHIWAKMLAAFFWQFCGVLVMLLCACILSSGDLLFEVVKAIVYLLKNGIEAIGAHVIFYCIEAVLLLCLYAVNGILLIFMCIALGQLFNRGRVGMAIAFYFTHSFTMQILGYAVLVFAVGFLDGTALYEAMNSFVRENLAASVHIVAAVISLISLIGSTVYFLVTRKILNKRINLE